MRNITRREFLKTTGMAVTTLGAYVALPRFATAGKSLTNANAPLTEILIQESARSIPIAYQSDVIITGGSSGAVAAAVAAAQAGSKVFLATPYHYLGEDLCATLRLWLEGNESIDSPLAQALFPGGVNQLPFAYTTDVPSEAPHLDTDPPSLLTDGKWSNAEQYSVQYPSDVTITVDLLESTTLNEVSLLAFNAFDFKLASVTISYSDDGIVWQEPVILTNSYPDQNSTTVPALIFSLPMSQTTRYLQFQVKRASGSNRLLLAQIIVQGNPLNSSTPEAQWMNTPLQVKSILDQALLDAGVDFLFGCHATDVLLDQQNNPAGIVIANRGGRQAILGKILIDATDRAWVARLAGAQSLPGYPAGQASFNRVTIGVPPLSAPGIASSRIIQSDLIPSIVEYSLTIPMDDGSHASWAKAEQLARDLTYQYGQSYASDLLFQVPPDPIPGLQSATGPWAGVAELPLDAFRPAGLAHFYLLNGCADVPRDQAAQLLRAPSLIDLGTIIGQAAAQQAQSLPTPLGLHFAQTAAAANGTGDVGEALVGVRPIQQLPGIAQPPRTLPVWGNYDVVVVGGGVSGAAAGIGAARQGANTLVLDPQHALGGVGTLGMVSQYYYGYNTGFSAEPPQDPNGCWPVEVKMEWWRSQLRQAGADIWFRSLGCGAFIDQGRVAGVVVATPQGRGIVLAKTVIDATGSADIAASAGAQCIYTDATDIAIQGTGLPFRNLTSSYVNTDFTITDETDLIDTWQMLIDGRRLHGGNFDSGQLIDSRERRRIVGDFTLQLTDILNQRTYPDTISRAYSVYDDHIYPIAPFFELADIPYDQQWAADIPYRCLLPQGLEGILVAGLGLSAAHDALPIIRMQRDMQNLGYAAGIAAFMAARDNVALRQIDIKALQQILVNKGNHVARILTDTDSYPLSTAQIQQAIEQVRLYPNKVAIFLSQPTQSLALLQQAYQAADGDPTQLIFAQILANLDDTTGLSLLIDTVNGYSALDQGWQFDGQQDYVDYFSPLDRLVIALGRTHEPEALDAILSMVQLLDADSDFSHHRTFARAVEMIRGRKRAAAPLAALLYKPGMQGHWIQTLQQAETMVNSLYDRTSRALSFRELTWARVLYRCGDNEQLGEQILTEYTQDLRGHFARHAHDVLQAGSLTVQDWRMYE